MTLFCSNAFSQQPGEYIIKLRESKSDSSRARASMTLAEIYFFLKPKLANHIDSGGFYLKRAQVFNKKQTNIKLQNEIDIDVAFWDCVRNPKLDAMLRFLPSINACKNSGDKNSEIVGWRDLKTVLQRNGMQTDSLKLICDQNDMSLSLQVDREDWVMHDLKEMAEIHMGQRRFDLAEKELIQCTKYGNKAGKDFLLYTFDLLGDLYIQKGEYNKGLFYGLKTIKLMNLNGDSAMSITYYSRIAAIYRYLGKFTSSIEWAQKALNKSIRDHDNFTFSAIDRIVICLLAERKAREALDFVLEKRAKYKPANLEEDVVFQMDLGKAYAALGENDVAEKSYLRMDAMLKNKYPFRVDCKAAASYAIGNFYFNRIEYSKARPYLISALNSYKELGTVQYVQYAHLALFKVDSAMGDLTSATKHLQESVRLKDSIFNVEKNRQIEELQIAYGTEEKEKNIKLLQNNGKLEQAKLEHEQNTRNWIIAGAMMFLIIAGLLYRQSAIRKKSNLIITRKNKLLEHLLKEKEWLIKEVHHRVKNNLQTVISLLQSQAAYLENDALKAIETSENRIYTMSLIHQKLYQSDDIQTINMADYIPELIKYLKDSFDTSHKIDFKVNIHEINLDASVAIPLALIINEALTNSIKYAFPDNRPGVISIFLNEQSESLRLELADNGIGICKKLINEKSVSLGFQLIKGLTKEIHGEVSIKSNNGVKIIILFKKQALEYANLLENNTVALA